MQICISWGAGSSQEYFEKRSINIHAVIYFHLPGVLYRSTKNSMGMPQGNARPAAHVSLDMIR